MRPPLDGSVTLITGASSGIGLELARELAPRVRALVLVARRGDRLNALRDELIAQRPELQVSVQPCDLGDRAAAETMLSTVETTVGPIDILVNNAGMGDFGLFERADWRKVEQMLELNVVTTTFLTRRLVAGMVERRRGGILNVSSGFGLEFMPGVAAYVGSKHFVTGFTESLRVELRKVRVVVSQLCPGPVATEFEAVAMDSSEKAVPEWVEISARKCARWAVRSFARGRAVIVPGIMMNLVMALGAVSPRWLKRLIYRPVAGRMRRQQERRLAAPAKQLGRGDR